MLRSLRTCTRGTAQRYENGREDGGGGREREREKETCFLAMFEREFKELLREVAKTISKRTTKVSIKVDMVVVQNSCKNLLFI